MIWVGSTPFKEIGMTVAKMELLEELAEDDNHWMKAHLFVKATTNRVLSSLSNYQRRWLTTIIMDLDIELQKKSWRY